MSRDHEPCATLEHSVAQTSLFATGDLEGFRKVNDELRSLTATQQIKYVQLVAECFHSIILTFTQPEEGTARLEQFLGMLLETDMDTLGAVLAEILLRTGHADRAMALLKRILVVTEPIHLERTRVEVLCVRGEVLLRQGLIAQAEAQLRAAIALPRGQESKLFELRATASLGRLLADDARPDEAQAMLETVYAGFTEGFETKDLQEAARVLAGLRESIRLLSA